MIYYYFFTFPYCSGKGRCNYSIYKRTTLFLKTFTLKVKVDLGLTPCNKENGVCDLRQFTDSQRNQNVDFFIGKSGSITGTSRFKNKSEFLISEACSLWTQMTTKSIFLARPLSSILACSLGIYTTWPVISSNSTFLKLCS